MKFLFNKSYLREIKDYFRFFYYKFLISDEQLIRKRFRKRLNREVNLENPIKFNDKLQWLKLNWDDPLAAKCADKFEVREFVEAKIGAQYLNEIIGIYDSVEDIKINTLPDKFVLKGTHGSGFNIICTDKDNMNWDDKLNIIKRWFSKNYYWQNREPVYKGMKPRVIAEKFLIQEKDHELRDYRFFCFDGEPKFISVDFNITNKNKTRRNLYDLNWNLLDATISYPQEINIKVEKPDKLNKMIEISEKLSAGFPHARVDFYYIDNKIIFGEITFFHQSGMGKISPEEFETKMGNWLNLPKIET